MKRNKTWKVSGLISGLASATPRLAKAAIGLWTAMAIAASPANAEDKTSIYTLSGEKDPTFEELLKTHGETNKEGKMQLSTTKPIRGSTVKVNKAFLEEGMGKVGDPQKIDRLKLDIATGAIPAKNAEKNYTRWYQVDDNTQIFRLFKGDKGYTLSKACRVEATSPLISTKDQVVVWEGSYCVPDPGSGAIAFQLWIKGAKVDGKGYPFFSLRAGEVYKLQHRYLPMQKPWKGKKENTFLTEATGKRVPFRFRYDGHYYEISTKEPKGEWTVIDGGTLPSEQNVGFRWGAYIGQNPGGVTGDKLILVTGAKIYTEKGKITPPDWVPADRR